MPFKNSKAKIQTLRPILFKGQLIKNAKDGLLNDDKIDTFFIHSFKEDTVDLKLPLPPHKKTVNDFVFIKKGEMERTISLESFHLKAGDFLLTPKNSITTTKTVSSDLEGYYCHFSDDFLIRNGYLKTWHTQTISQNLLHLTHQHTKNLETLLTRILLLYKDRNKEPSKYPLIHYYLSTFIAEVSILLQNQASPKITPHPILIGFNEMVQQYFRVFRNIHEYATLLHISPNHLNKIIKKETGRTASEIITATCILEAKALLLQTSLDVGEIATELGFEDISYFSRFFKKQTEITPSEYRKMIDWS